jgi:K+-transporting ATPase KdpF subunit
MKMPLNATQAGTIFDLTVAEQVKPSDLPSSRKYKESTHAYRNLVARDVCAGICPDGTVPAVFQSLRTHLRRHDMLIYLTAAVAAFLFIYLLTAMIRPEWF